MNPQETRNDFDGLVGRLSGEALLDLVSGKKTWQGLMQGVAFGTARWAEETITEPIRKQRIIAVTALMDAKKLMEPAFLPVPTTKDTACKYCGAMLFESGIGNPHTEKCFYGRVCRALKEVNKP